MLDVELAQDGEQSLKVVAARGAVEVGVRAFRVVVPVRLEVQLAGALGQEHAVRSRAPDVADMYDMHVVAEVAELDDRICKRFDLIVGELARVVRAGIDCDVNAVDIIGVKGIVVDDERQLGIVGRGAQGLVQGA